MGTIFISYRREESAGRAGRIYDRLRERFGKDRVFMDVSAIEPGVDFVETIDRAVGSCTALLVVIGRRWLECAGSAGRRRLDDPRDFIRLEVATALRRNIRVIPVLVQDAVMPDEDALPEELKALARRNAIEINDTHWDTDLAQLVGSLERVLSPGTNEGPAATGKSPAESDIEKKPPRPGKHLIWLIGSIAAAVVVLIVLFASVGSFRNLLFPERQVTVPEVGGMLEQDAVNTITSLGLRAVPQPRISKDRPGTVIGQAPPAGAKLAKGDEVRLVVASAARPHEPELVTLPNVVRQPVERAVKILTEAGLQPGTETPRPLKNVPPGVVVQQIVQGDGHIKAGSQVKRGTRIDLWVAVQPPEEKSPKEPPPTTQPRKMLAKRSLEICQSCMVDLDTGSVAQNGNADLWFHAVTATERYLTPRNGATISLSRKGDYESCARLKTVERPLPIAKLSPDVFVCVRTNQRHLAVLKLLEPVDASPGVLKTGYILWE